MLSTPQHDIIRATVPVLRAHGESITRAFYAALFDAHPELYDIFNPVNQVNGRQQRSVAGSILAYAAHIGQLDALGGMLERISNKHGSLEMQPEHYPIVGEHLLAAIRSVLGKAAAAEVLDAWGAAYGQLAGIMTGREAALYAGEAATPNGWRGFLPFRLERPIAESAEITSFLLVPEDGRALPPFTPGQYLTVKARPPGYPHEQIRQYSITHAPNGRSYRIAVRREEPPMAGVPAGLMSSYLHEELREGGALLVHMPLGDLVLDRSGRPVMLLSGGSGITPVLAMLDQLTSAGGGERQVAFIHAAHSREALAFGNEIGTLAARRPGVEVLVVLEQDDGGDKADRTHLGRASTSPSAGRCGGLLLRAARLHGDRGACAGRLCWFPRRGGTARASRPIRPSATGSATRCRVRCPCNEPGGGQQRKRA